MPGLAFYQERTMTLEPCNTLSWLVRALYFSVGSVSHVTCEEFEETLLVISTRVEGFRVSSFAE